MDKTYTFTPQEQGYFARKVSELNIAQSALQTTISFVIEQQGLTGTWQIKRDVSGLEMVDPPPPAASSPEVV